MMKLLATAAFGLGLAASPSAFAAEKTITLAVQHMTCAACPRTVKASLQAVPGVTNVGGVGRGQDSRGDLRRQQGGGGCAREGDDERGLSFRAQKLSGMRDRSLNVAGVLAGLAANCCGAPVVAP